MGYNKAVLLVLALIAAAQAFHKLVPEGQELVYEYKALVKAGTYHPEHFSSQFHLHGKLHVQPGASYVYMKFSDLKYVMYNGPEHHDDETIEVPVGTEVEDLYKPFKVVYDETGNAVSIVTEDVEKEYTRNIKRAVASIFQLDYTKVVGVKHHKAFVDKEHTIWGKMHVHYNVIPQENDVVLVKKMHEMKSSHHLYHHQITNTAHDYCEAPYEEYLTHDSHREYTVTKYNGHYVAHDIHSTGGYYVNPFNTKSIGHAIWFNQTFELISVQKIATPYHIEKEHVEEHLMHHYYDFTGDDFPDIYLGRRTYDYKTLIPQLDEMLVEVVKYMKKNHLEAVKPDIEHGQMINRVLRIMFTFDHDTLQTIWNNWHAKTSDDDKLAFQYFNQMLPYIGSPAAMKFIYTLVSQKKVDDHIAKHMLQELPFFVKVPTDKVLSMMEPLLHMTETSWEIQKAGILAYATLIHKADFWAKQQYYKQYHHDWSSVAPYDWDSVHYLEQAYGNVKPYKHSETIEKAFQALVTGLKAATEYEHKMIYLQSLFNTRLEEVVPYFEQVLKEKWLDEHLTLTALWGIYPMVAYDQDKVFEVYWPIMTNRKEHTHIRIVAYYLIMESHPTFSRMMNIYWYMLHEPNHLMYQFYYKHLHHMVDTAEPCKQIFKERVKQVVKYLHAPNFYGMTGYYLIDFHNPEYGYGAGVNTLYIHDKDTIIYKFTTSWNMFNVLTNPQTYIVKVHGVDGMEDIALKTTDPTKLFDYDKLINFFKDFDKKTDFHVEIVVMSHDFVTHSYYFNHETIHALPTVFNVNKLNELYKRYNGVNFKYIVLSKVFLPTELGFTSSLDVYVPYLEYRTSKANTAFENDIYTVHTDTVVKTWSHGMYGISFYNWFTDVWQGIARYRSYDAVRPMHIDFTYNTNQHTVKVSVKKHKDDEVYGQRVHVASMTYVKDDYHHNVLYKTAPKSKHWVYVTKGDKYRHDYPLINEVNSMHGDIYQMTFFDSENYVSNYTKHIFEDIYHLPIEEHSETIVGHVLNKWWNWWMHTIFHPHPGPEGVLYKYVQNKEHPITGYDLSFRFNREVKQEEYVHLPAMKYNLRATYVMKNEEKAVKTWDVNAIFDHNSGHTVNNVKMQISRIIPEQKPYKVCVEGTKKWSDEGVSGFVNVATTQASDGKCTKDDTIFHVTMVGEKSQEQITPYVSYKECESHMKVTDLHHQYVPCYLAHNTVRKYTYDVTTTNLPQAFKHKLMKYWDMYKGRYVQHYTFVEEPSEKVPEEHMKVVVEYPVIGDVYNAQLVTPNHEYHFDEIPLKYKQVFGFYPDSTHFSKIYLLMHHYGLVENCIVFNSTLKHNYEVAEYVVPTEWKMLVGDAAENAKYGVYVKRIEGTEKLALKVVHKTHTFEVTPVDHHVYTVVLDGKKLADNVHHHSENWLYYNQIPQTSNMVVISHHYGIHLYYDGEHVHIEVPKTVEPFYGKCFTKA